LQDAEYENIIKRFWQLRDSRKGLEKLALDKWVLEGRNEWWEAVLKRDGLFVNVWGIVSK
jgi:hypothetical protein